MRTTWNEKLLLIILVVSLSIILLPSSSFAELSSSDNYSLESHAITTGGNASSTNYTSTAVIEGATGSASSDSYTTQLGFLYESENNTPPYISSVSLASESGNELETDDILLSYTAGDNQSDPVRVVTDFRLNGTSIALLNMPFDLPVTDVNTYLLDYSTNGKDGILGGGTQSQAPAWKPDCVVGGCYDFDGLDDEIRISGPFNFETQDFTVAFWMKPRVSTNTRFFDAYSPGFVLRHGADYISAYVADNNSSLGGYSEIMTGLSLVDNWNHIALVFDRQNGRVDGYYNGQYNDSLDISTITGDMNVSNIRLGTYTDHLNGSLDELLIFDRKLSSAQIQEIYQAGLDNKSFETIKSDETKLNDGWTAKVTPVDGLDRGSSSLSNEVFIGTPAPKLIHNNSFVNETDAHAFLVTAGAYYEAGGNQLTSSISEPGACSLDSESINGDYYNATYRCVGTPFTSEMVSIEFCDSYSQCVSSASSSNTYPNQAPTMNSLVTPANGDDTIHDLTPLFDWQPANDPESDALNYTLNITTIFGCQEIPVQNVTTSEFTPSSELCPDALEKYYWTVRACDAWNCSDWHAVWNFTIEPYVDITMTNDQVDFGTLDILETNSTDGSADAFTFRSDSNVPADLINVTADQSLWDSPTGALGTGYMRIKAREVPSESGSFNTTGSLTNWFNLTTESQNVIDYLNYSDASDEAYIDLEVTVPGDEPPGSKQSQLTFTWEQS